MKDKFLKQAEHEYSPRERITALMTEGIFFLGILPGALVYFSPLLDHQFELPPLAFGVINIVLGCGFVVAGILFAWWTIYVQFTIGRGTPVPIMATQQLIIQKPYNYCRNPMALAACRREQLSCQNAPFWPNNWADSAPKAPSKEQI